MASDPDPGSERRFPIRAFVLAALLLPLVLVFGSVLLNILQDILQQPWPRSRTRSEALLAAKVDEDLGLLLAAAKDFRRSQGRYPQSLDELRSYTAPADGASLFYRDPHGSEYGYELVNGLPVFRASGNVVKTVRDSTRRAEKRFADLIEATRRQEAAGRSGGDRVPGDAPGR